VRRRNRLAIDAPVKARDLRFIRRAEPIRLSPLSPEFEPWVEMFGIDDVPEKASWIGRPELAPVSQQIPYATCLAHALCRLQETLLRKQGARQPLDADMFHQCVTGMNCTTGQPDPATHVRFLRDEGAPAATGSFKPDDSCPVPLPLQSRCNRAVLIMSADQARETISRHAPVIAIMTAANRFAAVKDFEIYRDTGTDDDLHHALLLVGYDDTAQCWEVQNSFGTGWGRNGFGRIAYGSCRIIAGASNPGFALY